MIVKNEAKYDRIRLQFESVKEYEELLEILQKPREFLVQAHKDRVCSFDRLCFEIERSFMESEYKGVKQYSSVIWENSYSDLVWALFEICGLMHGVFDD